MKRAVAEFLELLLVTIVFWSVVFCFFVVIRFYDLEDEPGISVEPGYEVSFLELIRFGVYLGLVIGLFYAIIEFIFDRLLIKRLSIGLSVLIVTFTYLALLIASVSSMMIIATERWGFDMPYEKGWWRSNETFWIFVAYFGLFSIVFSFLKIAKERFGRGNFLKLLLGQYIKPKEEERIVMFLDLKSSTTIAENLGHLKYSEFIKDCFLDLNILIDKYAAEIYQYVGDEAVLSWRYSKGIQQNNCLMLFFDFQQRILKRSDYYQEKYGVVPEFKAGLHGGKLVVVEVGSVKKELAYHGDVINTSSRIQDQCNSYGEKLLISEALLLRLSKASNYVTKELGDLILKGKQESMRIYAVSDA